MSSSHGVSRALDDWSWIKEGALPNDAAEGRRFLEELFLRLQADHWPSEQIEGIRLAVEEAIVNAVSHGNQGDYGKYLHLVCKVAPHCVRIEISDEGEGFDPACVADPTCGERLSLPHGRGLLLMRHFMCRVQFNDRGNMVVMEKFR